MVPAKSGVDDFFDSDNPTGPVTPPVELNEPPPANNEPPATPPKNEPPPATNIPPATNNTPPANNTTPPATNTTSPATNQPPAKVEPPAPVEDSWWKKAGYESESAAFEGLEKVKTFDPTPKYKSDNARKLDLFAGIKGTDDRAVFEFYQTEIKDDMPIESKIDLAVSKMIMDEPEYAKIKQGLVADFKTKLGLDVPEDAKATMSDADKLMYTRNLIDFNKNISEITKDIKEVQGKLNSGGQTPEEILAETQKVDARKTSWAAKEETLLKSIKIAIPDYEDDGKGGFKVKDNIVKDFIFDDDSNKAAFSTYFNHYVKTMGYPELTPEVEAQATDYAYTGMIKDNLPRMIKETISFTRSEYDKELIAKGVNPSILKPAEQIPANQGGNGESLVDKFFDS